MVLSTKWHLFVAVPCPPSSSTNNERTGTSSSQSHLRSGSLQETRQLPRGHSSHPWLGRMSQSLSPGSSPLPLLPFLKPFHLTKYLHEMAIRLPGFNEN